MTSPTSLDLRLLAESMDALDAATAHDPARRPPGGLCVTWHDGASTHGYRELAAAISRVVARRFDDLRQEALAELSAEHLRLRGRVLDGDG